jgi:hypothetical protein
MPLFLAVTLGVLEGGGGLTSWFVCVCVCACVRACVGIGTHWVRGAGVPLLPLCAERLHLFVEEGGIITECVLATYESGEELTFPLMFRWACTCTFRIPTPPHNH